MDQLPAPEKLWHKKPTSQKCPACRHSTPVQIPTLLFRQKGEEEPPQKNAPEENILKKKALSWRFFKMSFPKFPAHHTVNFSWARLKTQIKNPGTRHCTQGVPCMSASPHHTHTAQKGEHQTLRNANGHGGGCEHSRASNGPKAACPPQKAPQSRMCVGLVNSYACMHACPQGGTRTISLITVPINITNITARETFPSGLEQVARVSGRVTHTGGFMCEDEGEKFTP